MRRVPRLPGNVTVKLKGGRSYSTTPVYNRSRPRLERSGTVGVEFSMTGDKQLDRNLRQLIRNANDQDLEDVLLEAAKPMVKQLKAQTPKRSGDLARSAHAGTRLSPRQASLHTPIAPVEIFIGYGPYPQAHWLEFGTVRQAPRPTLRPIWEGGKLALFRRIASLLKSRIMRGIR